MSDKEKKNAQAISEEAAKKEDKKQKKVENKQEEAAKQIEALNKSVEDANKKAADAQKLADDYKDRWIRSVADFDNFRKRNEGVRKAAYTEGFSDAVKKLLFVGDNLDMAIKVCEDEKVREGLNMVAKKYEDALKAMNVTVINPLGEDFDPTDCEAVMSVEGEESGKVSEVFVKGYKLGETVIRYAKVSVVA